MYSSLAVRAIFGGEQDGCFMRRGSGSEAKLLTATLILRALGSGALLGLARDSVTAADAPPAHESWMPSAERTLVVALEIERDRFRLLAYTAKPRRYDAPAVIDPPRPHVADGAVQLELQLLGAGGAALTRRIDVGPLCLLHDGDSPPHIEGDTIQMHRDSVLVELPERPGFDRLELAYYEQSRGQLVRRSLGATLLDRERFTPAAGPLGYDELAFARPGEPVQPAGATGGLVYWPELYDDPDVYRIYGQAEEGDRRINIVIVPDGYVYAQKGLMQAHADALVSYFRGKTPYKEHDPFANYTLVYAYSKSSGTDQCDCQILVDTAMGTRFPAAGDSCGGSGNRCLSYGNGCDTTGTSNIVAAELRGGERLGHRNRRSRAGPLDRRAGR